MMAQSTKRINGKRLADLRKGSGHTQESFAIFCDAKLRTIQNAEYGKPITHDNYEKIVNGIIESCKLADTHTNADIIKRDLQPAQKTKGRSGTIESDYHIADLNQVNPVVPEYSPHVNDLITGKNRLLDENDFVYLIKDAYDVSSKSSFFDEFCKAIKSKEKIWHSNCEINDKKVISALEKLDHVIGNFHESKISKSLNELTSQMTNASELKDALSKLNDLDYQVFLGYQQTYWLSVPIFIIDHFYYRKVSYRVKCLHPGYGDNIKDFPYYCLEGGEIGGSKYGLWFNKKPYKYADADYMNRPPNEDGDPSSYPASPEEEIWFNLCQKVENEYTISEKGIYDQYCKQYLKSAF